MLLVLCRVSKRMNAKEYYKKKKMKRRQNKTKTTKRKTTKSKVTARQKVTAKKILSSSSAHFVPIPLYNSLVPHSYNFFYHISPYLSGYYASSVIRQRFY